MPIINHKAQEDKFFSSRERSILRYLLSDIINPLIDEINSLKALHNLPQTPKITPKQILEGVIKHKRNLIL